MIRLLAAILVLGSGSAWSQLFVNTLTNPQPDEPFDVLVTASFPDPGTFNPQITLGDDGVTITVDLRAACISSCPAASPSTRSFPMPPLAARTYTITVYLNQCCRPESAKLQVTIGMESPSTQSYQGLWLDPAEPGWGLSLDHQGTLLFATWFTYGSDGNGMWLLSYAAQAGPGRFTGTLYRTRGPAFNAVPFTPIGLAGYTQVGTITLSFTDANTGAMSYTLNGVTQSKPIERYIYATGGTDCSLGGVQGDIPNLSDLWVAAPQGSETGWGVNLVHQDDILFATRFTYGADGTGQWLVMSNLVKTAPGIYTGALQRTSGPPFSAVPFNPSLVKRTTVGSATFTFSDGDNGTFNYTLDGVSQGKPIVRFAYSSPTTVCQ